MYVYRLAMIFGDSSILQLRRSAFMSATLKIPVISLINAQFQKAWHANFSNHNLMSECKCFNGATMTMCARDHTIS